MNSDTLRLSVPRADAGHARILSEDEPTSLWRIEIRIEASSKAIYLVNESMSLIYLFLNPHNHPVKIWQRNWTYLN